MIFNKPWFFLILTSIGLLCHYTAHASVQYIDMSSLAPKSTLSKTPSIINAATTTPSSLSKRVPNSHIQTKLDSIIEHNARKYNIPPALLRAVIKQESNFNTSAISPKGARGLMQVMPSTAADYGTYNLLLPSHNIEVGSRHLSGLLKQYNLPIALAAYNAGEGTVNKYGGMPPFVETRHYVLNVLKHYNTELDKQMVTADSQSKQTVIPLPTPPLLSPKPTQKSSSVLYISLSP